MAADFHPLARAELWEVYEYYEQQIAGLGLEFVDAVDEAVQFSGEHPLASQVFEPEGEPTPYRRKVVDRFPYLVVYEVLTTGIRVMAIASALQKPRTFLERR